MLCKELVLGCWIGSRFDGLAQNVNDLVFRKRAQLFSGCCASQ